LIACTEHLVPKATAQGYEIKDHIAGYLNSLRKDPTHLGWGVWFVIERETNEVIGDIGFKGKPFLEHTVEIGYGIMPASQNKGYATEAVQALIEWAFAFEQIQKIVAKCVHDNTPSIKVLEKVNMIQVGRTDHIIRWELKKH